MTDHVPSTSLAELRKLAASRLNEATNVVDTNPPIDTGDLYSQAATWRKYPGVVAVCADLKGSTKLVADGMWDKSTASIYDAAVEPMARIYAQFGCDFIDIQGDGGFALFTGDLAVERGVCAAISLQTFSKEHLVPLIGERWKESSKPPQTGFKLGVASSALLARKVGMPRTAHSAPVWAGRAVNYAAKAAQQAGVHRMLITKAVADVVKRNDYLAFSCGCVNGEPGGEPTELWKPTTIEHVDAGNSAGACLESTWCQRCGDDFCASILDGEARREDTKALRARATMTMRAASA